MDLTVHEPSSGTTVTFSNAADALVARLRLEAGLGSSTVDLFIQSLRHPAFNTQQLGIKSVADIDDTVAAHRQSIQVSRSNRLSPLHPHSSQLLVPYPILECILDHIATDPSLVDEAMDYQFPAINHVEIQRSDCLRNCSLVHRSWTSPSQRRLARRIVVRAPQEIVNLLRNPLPGRHTMELIVCLGAYFSTRYQGRRQHTHTFQHSDVENDLINLLKRMPYLQILSIRECGLDESILVPALGKLSSLAALSWQCNYGHPSRNFLSLVGHLRCLPNVTSIELSGWNFRGACPETLPPLTQRLVRLHVSLSTDEQTNNIGYLFQSLSTESNSLTILSLDTTLFSSLDVQSLTRTFPSAQESLSNLHTLIITNKGGFSGFNLSQFRALVATCSSLRLFRVQSQNAQIGEFLDVLPASLEELEFSWFDMWLSPWFLIETHLPSLIQNKLQVPKLRKIVVHNYELAFGRAPVDEDGLPYVHPCPKTQEACNARGVELDLYTKPPHWRMSDT